jgi:hypothetical protein
LDNIQDSETHPEKYTEKAVEKFVDKRVKVLEGALPNTSNDIPYNPRTETISTEPPTSEPPTGPIPPSPGPVPSPTPPAGPPINPEPTPSSEPPIVPSSSPGPSSPGGEPSVSSTRKLKIGDIIDIYTSEGERQEDSVYRLDKITPTKYGDRYNFVNVINGKRITLSADDVDSKFGTKYRYTSDEEVEVITKGIAAIGEGLAGLSEQFTEMRVKDILKLPGVEKAFREDFGVGVNSIDEAIQRAIADIDSSETLSDEDKKEWKRLLESSLKFESTRAILESYITPKSETNPEVELPPVVEEVQPEDIEEESVSNE